MYLSKFVFSFIIIALSSVYIHPYQRVRESYLSIPKLDIYENIYRGYSVTLLNKGVVIDDSGNNWIIYGHRFSNRYPWKKYLRNLDKVNIGESILVSRESKVYEFIVKAILVVDSNDTWVLSQGTNMELTIITCTPIYYPVKRFVVMADFKGIKN